MTEITQNTNSDMQKKRIVQVAVVGGIVLAVGVGIGFVAFRSDKTVDVRGGTQAWSTSTDVSRADNNFEYNQVNALAFGSSMSAPSVAAITVSDQKPGNTVLVSLVSTDASAWLAVRENTNGLLGNILGARRVDVGTTGNVEIPLLRHTEPATTYSVMLFKDNGDKIFDYNTDAPMTAGGILISRAFVVR